VDITMPQLGETVTEGTVTRWLKQVGDQIAPDELIFEVSTDKVDSEVPAPGGGYLVEILVPEGTSDNHLYVIVTGALDVVRQAGKDEPLTLFTLGAGDLVGELSFIDGTKHYASLVATSPTRVFGIEREKLESLLHPHPDIVYNVMRAIVRTVHQIQRRLSMHSVELANYIYKQHGRY